MSPENNSFKFGFYLCNLIRTTIAPTNGNTMPRVASPGKLILFNMRNSD